MLVVIDWVLWIGPIGVFALAYVVGARAGATAFGALLHYVLIVTAVGTRDLARRLAAGDDRRAGSARSASPAPSPPSQALAFSHPVLARLPAGDAARRGQARRAGRRLGRGAADGGRGVPRDRAGDEPRRRHLHRLLVRDRADPDADGARRRRRGDHDDGRGRHSRPGELRHLDRADLHRHGRADRAARPADRGRDPARYRSARSAMSAWTSPPPRPSRARIGLRGRRGATAARTGCWRKAHEISHARRRPRSLRARHRLHADGPRRQHHLRRDAPRRRIDRDHPPRHRSRHHLLRHRRDVRPVHQRGAGRRGDQGASATASSSPPSSRCAGTATSRSASTAARKMPAAPAKAR